ncbi:MAG: enoyl-CoA hydratase/isomerase family protein, partial [Marinirhabdus sp.]
MTEPYVTARTANGISTIQFFHPAHNSLPGGLLTKLANALTTAGQNSSVKVIVLKSGGDRTFCAGASFKELTNINDAETGRAFFSGFAQVINAMRKCPKFIIGRVQGKAVGGGVGLAAATDYCMATTFAAIKLSELNVGIGPFVVGPAVERKIGLSAMSQIAIDANTFYDAQWACQKGLYTHVYDTTEALDEAVQNLAENLCNYNPEAMKAIKKTLWAGTENWDGLLADRAAISGKLVLSDFTKKTLKK